MRKRLLAGIGAAVLLFTGSTTAYAATETLTENLAEPIDVDNSEIVREFTSTLTGTVTGVTVTVDFLTHDGDVCAAPLSGGYSYPTELGLSLVSPAGNVVNLVYPWTEVDDIFVEGTYSAWDAWSMRAQVTFDDDASELVGVSSAGVPVTGTFRPVEPLSALLGEDAAGVWQVVVRDVAGGDVKCYYGATLNIESGDTGTGTPPVSPPVKQPTPAVKVETAA